MAKGIRRAIKVPPRKPNPPSVGVALRQPPPVQEMTDEEWEKERQNFSKLRQDYKHNREEFCRQYIIDFNGANAMRRMGSLSKQPWIRASEWLNEPYTQWYLSTLLQKLDDKAIVTRSEILMGLKREAHYYGLDGSAAARIAAFRTMAKILGLEITKIEGNMSIQGGVMTIPLSGSPEDWEKSASVAQAKLKEAVRK